MKTGVLVAAMAATGVIGGVVGAIFAQGVCPAAPAPAPAVPPSDSPDAAARAESLSKEVAELRARLEEMQGAVTASDQETAKVRAEMEREKKAAAVARGRIEGMEKGALPPGSIEPPIAGAVEKGAVPIRLGRVAARGELPASVKRTLELMSKTEEERWTAIRDALSLNTSQEEELKAAIKERDVAIRDMTKVETHDVAGPDGTTTTAMSVSHPDPEKMKDTMRRYDERVNGALTADQSKKWREEGYEAAAGGGGNAMVFSSSVVVESPK
jgi:hypothetical protein